MLEYAVVGSGIGGSAMAALLGAKGRDVALIEKEPYLGGCSSTFTHRNRRYNTGATTFAGFEEGRKVKQLFDAAGVTPALHVSDPALVVVQKGCLIKRYRDLDAFLDQLEQLHPHPKNRAFWTLIAQINRDFYAMQGYGYSGRSLVSKICSSSSYLPLAWRFSSYITISARAFMERFFGDMSPEYLDFMEAQILIVAQATSDETHFLTAALALGYTFGANHYSIGGMGSLFDTLTCKVPHLHRDTRIEKIKRRYDRFELYAGEERFEAANVVLNTTVYDSAFLFEDESIRRYYERLSKRGNTQSAFMLYATLRSDIALHHHYQIITEQTIPMTRSKALFVSFSDREDRLMSEQGYYSMTASIHTDVLWWQTLDASSYRSFKALLQQHLSELICATLGLEREWFVDLFSATPTTFEHYIGRSQLGGLPMTMRNHLWHIPSNDTPFKGLYHVGDTTYAAQGWPGVSEGALNLMRLLDV
ncbi:MAG: NAD(P)-binding protein [Campylobacterales bacterium]|nr:NAD(P)-binding protein [Campylobacterales bacterium]